MHQEVENVDTHGKVDDYGLKLPNEHEDKTGKILSCEIDTEIHNNGKEEKDPSLADEEDNIDKITAFDPKDSEDLIKSNKGKKDSVINESQESHSDHIMAVDDKKKNLQKKPVNVELKILKFKDQNKFKLPIVQPAFDDFIDIARFHPHREPIHEKSFDIFMIFFEIINRFREVLIMQRNNKVFDWILIVQQTISTLCLDMHDVTFSFIHKRTFCAWIHYEVNKTLDTDKSLAGPSVAMHQEVENVDTNGKVDDYGLKLPNEHEDETGNDQAKGKILSCEDTEIDTESHNNGKEEKDPSLANEEDNIDKITTFDPKDLVINESQENHNDHIMAFDDKRKRKKKTVKFKEQNKLKLPIHPHREPIHEKSFDIFMIFCEIIIEFRDVLMMQRNNKVFAWILIIQQRTFCAWIYYEVNKMPDCFQTQSEQCSQKESVARSSETSGNALQENDNINGMCDLNSGEVTMMKNTQNDKILTQKHRDTGQCSSTIKEMNTVSSHISLKGNVNEKILLRPALKFQYLKEHLKSEKKIYTYTYAIIYFMLLYTFMQSSYTDEILDAEIWYLVWRSDHPLFRCSNLIVDAVRFSIESIPPRPYIQLPAPALPLTMEPNSGFNVAEARAEVITAGANITASSAQEQSPNQSRETENMSSFSNRVLVEQFPSTVSADEGNRYLECSYALSLRPSNDDQKEATSSERTAIKGNANTNNSGSDETIPNVHFHQVEDSAASEENNTFPEDTPSQQIAEAGSIFIDSFDKTSMNYTAVRDGANSMASIYNKDGVAAASTPGSREIQKYLQTAAAQSVLDMGYHPKVVLLAIGRVLRNRVSEEMTGQMILEIVFEIEEEEAKKCPSLPSSELDQGNGSTKTNSLNNCPTNYTALRDNAPLYGAVGGVAAFTPGIGEVQNYLQTDAAQSVLDMGFQQTIVLLAIDRVLMKSECVEITGQMIMEAVFEIEEIRTRRGPSWLDQVNESTGEDVEGACADPFDHKEMKD